MSDMLKTTVNSILSDTIKSDYPHMQYPAALLAEVSRVASTDVDGQYSYTLRILDKTQSRDDNFPEVPGVISTVELSKGDVAVILLLYGQCLPYIIGRYYD